MHDRQYLLTALSSAEGSCWDARDRNVSLEAAAVRAEALLP